MTPKKYRNPLSKSKMRNFSCICGSKKKMKKCCGKDYVISDFENSRINAAIKKYRAKMSKEISDYKNKQDVDNAK